MARHNVPSNGESKADFMNRCVTGGSTREECELDFNRSLSRVRLSIAKPAMLLFDGAGFRGTDKNNVYSKDILKVGHYEHPVDGWSLDSTPEYLDHLKWANDEMVKNGVDVEIVIDHGDSAESVIGYSKKMDIDSDGDLRSINEFTSERGIELAETVKNVSVMIEPDFKDGMGREYGDAITHIAIVQQPIVPGQKPFEAIAASMKGVNVLQFSSKPKKGADPMLKKVLSLLGIKEDHEDANEEKVLSILTDRLEKDKEGDEDKTERVQEPETEVKELKASLSAAPKPEKNVDSDVQEIMAESAETKIQKRVDDGKLTPAAASLLKLNFVGKSGSRNFLAMSRNGGGNSQLDNILEAIDVNDPVELGEQSKAQTFSLSRETPGEEKPTKDTDENIEARAAKALGRKPKAKATA